MQGEADPKPRLAFHRQPNWHGNITLLNAGIAMGVMAVRILLEQAPDPERAKSRFVTDYIGKLRHTADSTIAGHRDEAAKNPVAFLFGNTAVTAAQATQIMDQHIDETEDYLRTMLIMPPRVPTNTA